MVQRGAFGQIRTGRIARKMDAYAVESGRNSITNQYRSRGQRVLVVARDGETFDHERWAQSNTFWQADQERLMVADNQTRVYTNGGIDHRRLLSAYAWGPQANPYSSGAQAN
jgi:hypothetical protein